LDSSGCSALPCCPGSVDRARSRRLEMMSTQVLRLYRTESAARKAGLKLAEVSGERSTILWDLLPEGEKKATYPLSGTCRLTVAERRWVDEHHAEVA
jgi:hypothetical protein